MNKILLGPPDIAQDDIDAVVKVLKSGQLSLGQQTEKFEQELAEFFPIRLDNQRYPLPQSLWFFWLRLIQSGQGQD